jgi:hypothetical protein
LLNRCEDELKRVRIELAEQKRTGSNWGGCELNLREFSIELQRMQTKLGQA